MSSGASTGFDVAVVAVCAASAGLAGVRWLRVAQREHYLPGTVSRFALRWWLASPASEALALAGAAGLVLSARWPVAGFATAVAVAVGPFALGLRGRTSPLDWTRRLRTLAAAWVVLEAAVVALGTIFGAGPAAAAAAALAAPALLDAALALTAPLERHLVGRFVARAANRLARIGPRVVAVTGSYGKTSTKGYVAHLLSGTFSVTASPASFNNRAGLARTVNEQLADGTEVLVAEMGTYGRGEIAELCRWMGPEISVITAVGPVHLERFRTEDAIVEAKAEILEPAQCVVLYNDDPRLAALADHCQSAGKTVWRVSEQDPAADVCVESAGEGLVLRVRGEKLAELHLDARPGNIGCAVAVALQLGVDPAVLVARLATLPAAPHRLEPVPIAAGRCLVLDDTYNANPRGARVALEALLRLAPPGGRRVVVTPGMVELGPRQREENAQLAALVAGAGAELVVVGRTNRRALLRGAPAGAVVLDHRDQAVAWVRHELGEGDAVLFENDLPDHYP